MRLRRVEAVRYGRLEGASLGDLGPGLTVVFGPNEAGKSTYTALVRHVLYGFPTPGAKEVRYLSEGGKRQGRLVFEDTEGMWAIERTEGPHGGPVTVSALQGPERPSLLDEIRHGVSTEAYRVVFGFGLADMAQIEELRGKEDGIVARLYAAGAGLAVSPQDVRAAIDKRADELWAPRGSTRLLNRLHGDMRGVRSHLRELENEASRFASEQSRLAGLRTALEDARERRESAAVRFRALERDVAAVAQREDEIESLDRQLLEARRALSQLESALDRSAPDERVIAAAPEIEAVLADVSSYRDRIERLGTLESVIADLSRRVDGGASELGLSGEALPDLPPAVVTGVERWRDALSRAEVRASQSERSARDAHQRARVAEETVPSSAAPAPSRDLSTMLPAIATTLGGLAVLATGLVTSHTATSIIGVALLLAGVGLAVWQYQRGQGATRVPDAARLAERAVAARAEAVAAQETAADDAAALAGETDAWHAWLRENGLQAAGENPAAVAAFVAEVKTLRQLAHERSNRVAEASGERTAATVYVERVAAAATPLADAGAATASPGDALLVAERLRETLTSARKAEEEHLLLQEKMRAEHERLATLDASRQSEAESVLAIMDTYDLSEQGLAALRGVEDAARSDAERAAREFEDLATGVATLDGTLGREGRESEMGELRLELTTLDEQRMEAARRYVVLAVASRLLARSQERYERERQPEVVRAAEAVFTRITANRYTGVTIPLGTNEIRVSGQDASVRPTEELSRGTAEQLYLALRIGLIQQLSEVGPGLPVLMDDILVNFDAERRTGAAQAIADLSRARQVVVFTCHAETADVLAAAEPTRTLVELDRCSL